MTCAECFAHIKSDFILKSSLKKYLGKYSDSHLIVFVFPSSKDSDFVEIRRIVFTAADTVLDSHQIPFFFTL